MTTMKPGKAYAELIRLAREESILASCADLLEWDEETYMPRGGVDHRADQMALLAGMLHDLGTSPRFGELLAVVEASDLVADPEGPEAVNVRELRREFDREARLPRKLVEESARVVARAQQAWTVAREEDDYGRFAPWLERIVALSREEADAVGYAEVRYDALLQDYEPGITTREVTELFRRLREELVPLVEEVAVAPRRPHTAMLRREYPVDRQRLFGQAVAAGIGFDLERGRMDSALHPFCMPIGPGDIRLAVRYAPREFAAGLFVVLHEVGHALYDQGLDAEHYGTPMGEAASLGMHESQSRLWENFVGRSRGFWQHFFPRVRNVFHEALHDVSLDEFYFAVNHVEPGLNRGSADEVTYNLHILIRFELEQALLSGALRAADLPLAWSEAYRKNLGVEPGNVVEGCLQDGHWAEGLFGYFPTYALGNIYAAQLVAAATAELGGLDSAFARGDFVPLLEWLRDHVHRHGQRYSSADLIERATGMRPDHRPLIEHLRSRYQPLYGL